MPAQRYRKKPVIVEAMQWTGDNAEELTEWTGGAFYEIDPEERCANPDATGDLFVAANVGHLSMTPGEWVLKDRKGFYPVQPDLFAETYDAVES